MRSCLLFALGFLGSVRAFKDCDQVNLTGLGPYGPERWFNGTAAEDGSVVFVFHPDLSSRSVFPVIIFSHGSAGEYAMYRYAIQRYVTHGFVVVFPHIESPSKDVSPLTLDPHGKFTIKGLRYAVSANSDAGNALHNKLDIMNIILAGHSMGATSTIMASTLLPSEHGLGKVKACLAQHPGICGPFGPPPCVGPVCETWMPSDLAHITARMPVLLTTATNDGAFWPAPYTAEHEEGCFNKSTAGSLAMSSQGTVFAQFSAAVCQDDGKGGRYNRKWSDGGHDCPMGEASPETQWVLIAAKLYAQFDGSASSACHAKLWGPGAAADMSKGGIEKHITNPSTNKSVVEQV